jgi:hypothetical protein
VVKAHHDDGIGVICEIPVVHAELYQVCNWRGLDHRTFAIDEVLVGLCPERLSFVLIICSSPSPFLNHHPLPEKSSFAIKHYR